MQRVVVRRAPTPVLPIALGLALGTLAGFVLGELAGPIAFREFGAARGAAVRQQSVAELVYRAQSALDDDLLLRECRLHVVPVGPGRLELHGWVQDRRARARAVRLVSDAVDAAAVINCVQVHGEDDDPSDPSDADADERLA